MISVNFDKIDSYRLSFFKQSYAYGKYRGRCKGFLVLLKIQETYMFTDEAKNTIKQSREKITNAIMRLYNKVGVRLNNLISFLPFNGIRFFGVVRIFSEV